MGDNPFNINGYKLLPDVLSPQQCDAISLLTQGVVASSAGSRTLLDQDWCAELAANLRQNPRLSNLLMPDAVAVQCTYFQKSKSRNWLVPLHQDLLVPVAERVEHPALRGWCWKEGTLFVQPPVSVLESLIVVRLHLDECSAADGPLRVVPGTHTRGLFEIGQESALRTAQVPCAAKKGAALAMRPLLLHSSSKSTGSSLRRVLHFIFGCQDLPHGLRWQHAV
jgi:Phytanoyl-CoA dioxygenase (PhyH)